MKKKLLLGIFSLVALFGPVVQAQQSPVYTGSLQNLDKTDLGTCLKLYEQLSVKQEGKASSYRLIGTKSIESGNLLDTHRIWYSHDFTSNVIPPLASFQYLNSEYGFTGTLFDSVVKFVPDPQNPGQVKTLVVWGYSFNNDLLPIAYHYKYYDYFYRDLYTYNGAKKPISMLKETDSAGIWTPTVRDEYAYVGNQEFITGFFWNKNAMKWDTLYKKYIWYDANSQVDSIFRENLVTGVWRNFEAFAYDYDNKGQRIREARYMYNGFIKDIEPLDLVFKGYDTGGKLISEIIYNGPNLDLVGRNLFHYSGLVLDSIGSDAWDAGSSGWNDAGITLFTYNAGIITKKESFINENGGIRPYNKMEFTSDANQNISTSAYFVWTPHTGNYSTGVKHYYTYEPYGTTHISLVDGQKEMIHLYPNPAKEKVHIEIPFDGSGSYKLFSLEGKEVVAARFDSGSERVQVLELDLKSGIYMFLLSDESGKSYSGKLAID